MNTIPREAFNFVEWLRNQGSTVECAKCKKFTLLGTSSIFRETTSELVIWNDGMNKVLQDHGLTPSGDIREATTAIKFLCSKCHE